MQDSIWTKNYEINSFLVNSQGRVGLYALLNILQDAAWLHATDLGQGAVQKAAEKSFWVLTRQKVVMREWPMWGNQLQVRTWIRPPTGPFAIRDFEIDCRGQKIGDCATSWLTVDAQSRKPLRDHSALVGVKTRDHGALTLEMPKIELRENLATVARFEVRNSDLDMNNHVNNTRYAQWILDSIPSERHREFRLLEYEINFLAEARSGDTIEIKSFSEDAQEGYHQIQFQGWRDLDQKNIFAARLLVQLSPT